MPTYLRLLSMIGKPLLALLLVFSYSYLWYSRGQSSVRAEWLASDNQRKLELMDEQAKALKKTQELQSSIDDLSKTHETQQTKIDELSKANTKLAHTVGLYDKHKAPHRVSKGCPSGAPKDDDGASEDNRLSDRTADFLITLTDEASRNTAKLLACQNYIKEIRKVSGD